jgi:hypothetical protein
MGRQTNWRHEFAGVLHEEREELARAIEEVERFLTFQSDQLREALEDHALQSTYDRQLGPLTIESRFLTSLGQTGADLSILARRLQIALAWFNPDLVHRSEAGHSLGSALDKAALLREKLTLSKKKDLLQEIRVGFEKVFDAVRKDVEDQVTMQRRTGGTEVLFERWKMQMSTYPAYAPNAWGFRESPVPEQPQYRQPAKGRQSDKKEAPAPEKTWVEFRLVDQDGKPVPGAAYKVTLPDGSVSTGSLNDQGAVRFEGIDPGNCRISFTDIDGNEWKAA